ncbi:bacteriocin immunity protein [Pseudomonas sp. ABY48]|uniref:bacteriocin immunity protein n=1 Tax=Pseudomonas sp. ABY48 TaxID=3402865 RepID=UPI003B430CBD
MELKPKLQDYTESEFQMFVDKIWSVDASKEDHDRLINHFDRIVGHPSGADLLFYPEDAFKGGILPAPVKLPPKLTMAEHNTARAKHELAKAQQMAMDIATAGQTIESAFSLLENAVRGMPIQQHPNATLEELEKGIRQIEHAQHELLMAVRAFERKKMRVEFDKDAAQRNLAYNQADRAVWQANLQQATTHHAGYIARLSLITQRHAGLHVRAKAMVDHAWEQLARVRTPNQYPNLFRLSIADNGGRPDLLISGAQPLTLVQRLDLQKTIRSAVAAFSGPLPEGSQEHLGQYAGVLSFSFASRAKAVRFGLCVAVTELSLTDSDWQALAAQRGNMELPLRMGTTTVALKPGSLSYGLKEIRELFEIYVAPCAGELPAQVRVRPAVWHDDERAYRFTADGPQPAMIEWTHPDDLKAPTRPKQDRLDSVGSVRSSPVPELALFDCVEEVRFDDYVVVFPPETGLEPVYVLFNDRRDCPGVVSGEGHAEADDWQTQASSSQGAAVPASVADHLRGQVFERFDLFTRVFWKAVAAMPTLSAQFNIDNRALLLSGSAPRSELAEDNRALRILHRVDTTQGGDVYDLDNLIIRY